MNLPKLDTPVYTTQLPSDGKEIKYRPFLVKEEKVLLIALQEKTNQAMLDAVKQIISNCTFEAHDVDKFTSYDLEWLFLQIRIKSKGEMAKLVFKCKNQIMNGDETEECGEEIRLQYDLQSVEVEGAGRETNKKIMLDDAKQIGMILVHPTFESTQKLIQAIDSKNNDVIGEVLFDYVDTVFAGEKTYDDFTQDEFSLWLETLSTAQFQLLKDFFNDIPRLSAVIPIRCPSCENESDVTVQGLASFLA